MRPTDAELLTQWQRQIVAELAREGGPDRRIVLTALAELTARGLDPVRRWRATAEGVVGGVFGEIGSGPAR